MSKVAFIGLGNMGSAMAARLLTAGHELNIYNRTASRGTTLARLGANLCATPREVCIGVDAVVSMVADDRASRSVWLDPDGVLASDLPDGAFAIECSTLSHDWVTELASQATARGLRYIDAPVTGLPESAAAGELTLLVGADPGNLSAARELLAAFSNRIIHFGAVGTGTAYKLMINMLGAVQIASAAECMAIAERVGLDLHVVADAIATGQAASPQVIRNTRRMADGNHSRDIVFTPQLRLKDVRYGLQLAQNFKIGAPFAALAGREFAALCELASEQSNESRIFEIARSKTHEEP
jgi:3-hydroxyisobutyrate dehydrogenase